MVKSTLLGFVRKNPEGTALKVCISAEAFAKAEKYTAINGEEFVMMVMNLNSIEKIIDGQKEVSSVSQVIE